MKHIWKFFILIPITPIIALAAGLTQPKIVEIIPHKTFDLNALETKNVAVQVILPKTPENAPQWQISQIKAYVARTSMDLGLNPVDTAFIVEHESQWDATRIGDDGASLGLWQIDRNYHPEVSESCALDVKCSTLWSLNYLLKGKWNEWSTWRFRCQYYPYDNPPNCNE